MKIDGKQIASEIIDDLKVKVDRLKEKGVTPHLYIITFGENPQTESYLKQKMLRAGQVGAKITIKRFDEFVKPQEVFSLIEELNRKSSVHGIIVQRPMPEVFDEIKISNAVDPKKDVDGFNPDSQFEVPVALAVFELLKRTEFSDFEDKNVVLVGKGVTAGKPIINLFNKKNINSINVDSKTENENQIFKNADVIVFSVGKKILNPDNLKKGVILIGVGIHTKDGKLKGDYNEAEIEKIASFYSPTPGGVGPVNVAMLMKNLVEATEKQLV